MNSARPDVVFDCNVYLQAIARSNGPAARALRLVEQNVITLHVSRAILRELRATIDDSEIRSKNPHLTDAVIDGFINALLFRGAYRRNVPRVSRLPRDPDDEPYLDLATAVAADYLVTRDRDLLSLSTDHSVEGKEFRQRLPQLSILNPVDFLSQMMQRFPAAFASTP